MELELIPALIAGLTGTVIMTVIMALATAMGLTNMPPMHLVIGSMMTGQRKMASLTGMVIHLIVMGSVTFGLIYAAAFVALNDASVATGAGVGLVHGIIVGAMAMPVMGWIHPRMRDTNADDGASAGRDGRVALTSPGFFGVRWGSMTPRGMIVGHVIFGMVVAVVYTAIA